MAAEALSEATRRQEDALAQCRSLTYDLEQARRVANTEKTTSERELGRLQAEADEARARRDEEHTAYMDLRAEKSRIQERVDELEAACTKAERQAKRDAQTILEAQKDLEEALQRASKEKQHASVLLSESRQSEEALTRELEDLRRQLPSL